MRKPTHKPNPPRRRRERRASGFTLIELMVVIAIILVLLGVGASLGPGLLESQRRSATRGTMLTIRAVVAEYEVQTQTVPNHLAVVTAPYDWSRDKARNTGENRGERSSGLDGEEMEDLKARSIERFVWATLQVPDIQEMYARLSSETLNDEDGNGFLELRDAWGNKLVYAASVDRDSGNDPSDADDFLPERSEPFFASPGPDGLWGDEDALERRVAGGSLSGSEKRLANEASDNVYSFELED